MNDEEKEALQNLYESCKDDLIKVQAWGFEKEISLKDFILMVRTIKIEGYE